MKYQARFRNGENFVNKTVKRGYLRREEENLLMTLMMVGALLDGSQGMFEEPTGPSWEVWERSGILTKEQRKYLKTATTYIKKFTDDVLRNNLDYKEKAKLLKKAEKFSFRLVDDYQLQKVYSLLSKSKEVSVDRGNFEDLIDAMLYANCKGCKKQRTECKLRDFYDEYLIPHTIKEGEPCDNCEYAY